jgi:surface antigen
MHDEQAQVISSFLNARGQTCHVVEQRVWLAGGERVRATGTMCRQGDGRWVLVR